MPVFKKKLEEKPKEVVVPKKTDAHCTNDGCYEVKAPGQTHVCVKHIRT